MITKKKYFALTLCLILILACSIILAGCGEVSVYGKKFSYQGEINVSWSSLHEENGKGIENIITNQMKADNIDWSQTGFDEEIRDLTSLNFKNGKEALEHFKEEFNKVVEPHTQGLLLTFGTEEEKILTVSSGDRSITYALKNHELEGFLAAYPVVDGVESEQSEFFFREKTNPDRLFLNGANFEAEINIKLKNPIKDYGGEDTNYITINLAIDYSQTK